MSDNGDRDSGSNSTDKRADNSNGKAPELDASGSQGEEGGEEEVCMVDLLAEQEALQENADAVLGASDDQNCTYLQGYVDRQALYSCRTCAAAAGGESECAGICLACSHECHEGHELIELYTKRKFCCDCGNSKFVGNPCKLCPDKRSLNTDNVYNQNYKGLYCKCSRPYPDEEDTVDDVMLQCVVCEDWFHQRHVCQFPVDVESWEEMVCDVCMRRCQFLWTYARLNKGAFNPSNRSLLVPPVSNDHKEVDVIGESDDSSLATGVNGNQSGAVSHPAVKEESDGNEEGKTAGGVVCHLSELGGVVAGGGCQPTGPVFWPAAWRRSLCTCCKCSAMYAELGVAFLIDETDSITAYEQRGKDKGRRSLYQQGLDALSTLGRVQQIELLQGYADMKSELSAYLKKFTDNHKVVRQEDIAEFFTQLEARKRRRTDTNPSQNYDQ